MAVVLGLLGVLAITRPEHDSSTSALLDRALAAHVDGRLDDAELLYRRILAQDPTDKLANYNLGLVAQTEGRVVEAERSYRRALATDPAYGPALFNLAVLKYQAGHYAEAVALYRQVVSIDQTSGAAHLNLGYALRRDGQVKAGNEQIALAIELAPDLASQAPPDATTTTSSTSAAPAAPGTDGGPK
jgi:tetratricopeptide (TPR) repeat protein